MNIKLPAIISGGLAALVAVAAITPSITGHSDPQQRKYEEVNDSNRAQLLGIDNAEDYFLGVASQFSVFVREDFTAIASDCEGRLAAGGSANLGETPGAYEASSKTDPESNFANVVIGGSTLRNFQASNMKFVCPDDASIDDTITTFMDNDMCSVYHGQLFDFDEVFSMLEERSAYLAEKETNAKLDIDPFFNRGWTITGTDENLNVLSLTADQLALFTNADGDLPEHYFKLDINIPEGSYLVINVPGKDVVLPITEVSMHYVREDGTVIDDDIKENKPILYNLSEAEKFKYAGSTFGSTLAPKADASGDEGGHVAGATIAKSFSGGIQFGNSTVNLKSDVLGITYITINKFDITGEQELDGAKLAILDKTGENVVEIDGQKLEWTSESGSSWNVEGLPDGEYILKETGDEFESGGQIYTVITTELKFTVKNGKVTVTSGASSADSLGKNEGYYVDDNTIKVCDAVATTTSTTTSTTTTTTTTTSTTTSTSTTTTSTTTTTTSATSTSTSTTTSTSASTTTSTNTTTTTTTTTTATTTTTTATTTTTSKTTSTSTSTTTSTTTTTTTTTITTTAETTTTTIDIDVMGDEDEATTTTTTSTKVTTTETKATTTSGIDSETDAKTEEQSTTTTIAVDVDSADEKPVKPSASAESDKSTFETNDSPKTGDTGSSRALGALAALAAATAALAITKKRNH